MRTLLAYGLTGMLLLAGCSQTKVAPIPRPAPKPILIDEYSVLDDKSSAPSISDAKLQKQLEVARAHYLKALKLVEKNDQQGAAKHFEASVAILNGLMTHPDIDALPEYSKLSQSVIRDYEDKITSIESLDSTSSFFVLRDKMFQEIELLPVTWSRPTSAVAETGPEKPDTLQIGLNDNEAVDQTIAFFTSEKGRKFFSKWLARSGRFFAMYERILEEEGAPEELKYLSMIESGLNPTVTSKAQAVGLWQFISSTGKEYGMQVDWYRDERRDPEKATRAAARYLTDLYEMMGDWHLALASYNCGPGRMRRAIRQADTADYWIARQFLPRETRQYVPLYIAAAKIARDPAAYGFTDIVYEQPDNYETVPVTGAYEFKTLADAVGISVETLRDLNPELLRDKIPPGESNYRLRVPSGYSSTLAAVLDTLPAPEEASISWVRHKVKKGETVTRIAAQYGVSVSELLEANGMNSKSRLVRGKVLKVPVPSSSGSKKQDGIQQADASATIAEANPQGQDKSVEATAPAATQPKQTQTPAAATASRHTGSVTPPAAPAAATTTVATAVAATVATNESNVLTLLADAPTAERKSTHGEPAAINQPVAGAGQATQTREAAPTTRVAAHSAEPKAKKEETAAKKKEEKKASVVVHKVKRGETLSGIATRYGVSMNDLKEWNPKGITRKNEVLSGASLRVYQNGAAPAAAKKTSAKTSAKTKKTEKKSARPKRYKVRRGESLNSIADKFGVKVSDLRKNNPRLKKGTLKAGQVINLR